MMVSPTTVLHVDIGTCAAWATLLSFAGGCAVALVKGMLYTQKWWRRRHAQPTVEVISPDEASAKAPRQRAQIRVIEWDPMDD